ncbi:MAG TPA: CPBP family intramembrane metalloprotease [Candidatus Kapabacteria bacterium]|nr:CPBP family intramembrane metalloprotease [Candidatus Kapabacteria bacterium]
MNIANIKNDFSKAEWKTYSLLLSAPILLSLYYYFGYAHNFVKIFPSFASSPELDFYSHIYQFASFFVLLLVIPLLFQIFAIKKPLSDIGFGLGDTKFGAKLLLIIPIAAPIIYFAVMGDDVRTEYPLAKILHSRHELIFVYELMYVLLYYIAWEFFFRGFLLFNLSEKFGATNAIIIQTISSCLIHLGKPAGETIGAIIVGVIFGYLAIRTRSFWYVFALHITLGVLTDLFIIFFHGAI